MPVRSGVLCDLVLLRFLPVVLGLGVGLGLGGGSHAQGGGGGGVFYKRTGAFGRWVCGGPGRRACALYLRTAPVWPFPSDLSAATFRKIIDAASALLGLL
jgi:hypothetical protein